MGVKKAVVLAAGRGARMQSLTADCPKPMLPLAGRPMLAHTIERLEAAGIREVLLVVGYRAEMVRDYFEQHPPVLSSVSYIEQQQQNGTGRAALLAREFAGDDSFLLTNGDILVEPEVYRGLIERLPGAEMALALKQVDDPYQGAAVYIEGDRVVKIVEKPPQGASTTNWTNAGIYLFRSAIFEQLDRIDLSPRGEYEITDAIHAVVDSGAVVRWHGILGFWRDIGRPEDLPDAERFVESEA